VVKLLIIAQEFYHLKKKLFILFLSLNFFEPAFSQTAQFSLSTDLSVLHSFKKEQRFWAIGQTITGHFNFTPKDGLYVWFAYYGNGKFSNQVTAPAKDTSTVPQQVVYTNNAIMRFRHFSTGWRHYLKGGSNIEEGWSLYGYAGLGIFFGEIANTHSVPVDTAHYTIPVWQGKGNFKRLTLDLALGYELPVGGDIFFYIEGRVLVPTTDYPSNYLFINANAPLTGSVNGGMRIIF